MSAKKNKEKEIVSSETIDSGAINSSKISPTTGAAKAKVSLKEYNKTAPFSFNAKHYKLLLIGLGINILGFILMIGGATEDPNKFDANELFSHTRITIAPMLVVAGYVVIMYSIMKRPKEQTK